MSNTSIFRQNINSKITSNNNKEVSAVKVREVLDSGADAIDSVAVETQTLISQIGLGTPKGVYATAADLTTADPDHSFIYIVQANGGWYYWGGSSWVNGGQYQSPMSIVQASGTSLVSVMSQKSVTDLVAQKSAEDRASLSPVKNIFRTEFEEENIGANSTFSYTSGFSAMAYGRLITGTKILNREVVYLDGVNQNVELVLKIYKRLSAESANTAGPGLLGTDILLGTFNYPASSFTATDAVQTVGLIFPEQTVTDCIVLFYLAGKIAAGAKGLLGTRRHTTLGEGLTQYQRGWTQTTNVSSFASVSGTSVLSRILYSEVVSDSRLVTSEGKITALESANGVNTPKIAALEGRATALEGLISLDFYDNVKPVATITGLNVDLAGTKVYRSEIIQNITGTVTITPTLKVTGQSNLNKALTYTTETRNIVGIQLLIDALPVQNISNVVVKRTSDQVVLTTAADYRLFALEGKISGKNAGVSSVNVDITFDYEYNRLDIIQLNLITNVVSIKLGAERRLHAQEEPYRPLPDDNNIVLYYVTVRGGSFTLVDATGWEGYMKQGREMEYMKFIQRSRNLLPKTFKKLQKGEALTIASYGDSISANESTTPPYTKNGSMRDRLNYLSFLQTDFRDTIPLYTNIQLGREDDGVGAIHIKVGWNWYLRDYLQKKYGSVVTYDNYSIGGSNSGNTGDNGSVPARLAVIKAAAPDLVIVAFSMNEPGRSTTYQDLKLIVTELQSVGCEVILFGLPRPNGQANRASRAVILTTENTVKRVAIDTNCAHFPTMYFTSDSQLGYMGVDANYLCSTNLYNHPGVLEMKKYGLALSSIF